MPNIESNYNKRPNIVYTFNNVADAKEGRLPNGQIVSLNEGETANTLGYYSPNDGGGASYIVVAGGTGVSDGLLYIDMDNGNQLEFIMGSPITADQAGAIGNGATDDSAAIQAVLDANKIANLNEEAYATSSSLTLLEQYQLKGTGSATRVGGFIDGGCWIDYTGTSNAIEVDGEFVGFDSRRSIYIGGFSLRANSGLSAINADFLTKSELHDLELFGAGVAGSVGMNWTNCYNNEVKKCSFVGFETGHIATIKETPNDVFSGQTHYDSCDFWDSTINGCEFTADYNVFAQILMSKCHWKTNTGVGLVIDGANIHTIEVYGGHFEENDGGDVHVTSTVVNGPRIRAHFNSAQTANPKVLIDGNRTFIVDGCEFVSGGTSIEVNGDANVIGRSRHSACTNPIVISSSATNTFIGRQDFNNITGTAIQDAGQYTRYEGERTISIEVDLSLSGTAQTAILAELDEQYWLYSVKFTNATALSGTPVLNVGRTTSLSKYINALSLASTAQWATETVERTSLSAFFADAGDIFTVYNETGSLTGRILVEIRMIPWQFF